MEPALRTSERKVARSTTNSTERYAAVGHAACICERIALTMRVSTVLVYLAALAITAGCSDTSNWAKAMKETKPGMSRSEVVAKLTTEAWYYQPCPNGPYTVDLFFFDSHQYDRARIVIVRSLPDSMGALKVVRVSTFDDYAWQGAYSDCVQRDKFED